MNLKKLLNKKIFGQKVKFTTFTILFILISGYILSLRWTSNSYYIFAFIIFLFGMLFQNTIDNDEDEDDK